MFQEWRIKLKQAEGALQAQRLEEAKGLLNQPDLRDFQPARELIARLALQFARRGETHALAGESRAGWHDLETAEELGVDAAAAARLRGTLTSLAIREAEAYLAAESPQAALERLKSLESRQGLTREARELRQVAVKMVTALKLAAEGKFVQAITALDAARQLRPDLPRLEELCRRFADHDRALKQNHEQLHAALANQQWQRVAVLAEQILAFAPGDSIARDARKQAWAAVGAQFQATRYVTMATHGVSSPGELAAGAQSAPGGPAPAHAASKRFLMWVDGVGGFLVCEGDEVRIGQPVPENLADLPILGDLSRDHASIRRSGDGYLIVPRRKTRLDGQVITDLAPLRDGCLLELGEGVKLRFRRPHPLSTSATLSLVSRHRTQPPSDGIILLADSCVLGPRENSHVLCRVFSHDVVIFRRGSDLLCRFSGELIVDGRLAPSPAVIGRTTKLKAGHCSITLETV